MRARDERGVALPSAVVLLSIIAVAMAGLTFLATDGDGPDARAQTVSQPAGSPTAAPSATPTPSLGDEARKPEPRRKRKLVRSEIFVEVYNNTGIKDLAASAALDAAGVGWNIVGTDNWLGTIPATAVYHPPRLERAAKALARDLGIPKTVVAIEPMKLDRLTVILTLDYV